MSRSCTAISLNRPPPPLTYSNGGGAGSRLHSFTAITSPTCGRCGRASAAARVAAWPRGGGHSRATATSD
eukprot:7004844-Prymnesium_polylepis.1